MKILFYNRGWHLDFQSSALMHGLRNLLGDQLVDYPIMSNLYKESLPSDPNEQAKLRSTMYGRGFTYPFTLPSIDVDRENIEEKLKDRYFDAVFFGPCDNQVKLGNPNNDVFWLAVNSGNLVSLFDGDDLQFMTNEVIHHDLLSGVEKSGGVYFKRELQSEMSKTIAPVCFAFPKEKATISPQNKEKVFALESSNDKGYKFDNEEDYYSEYRRSYFGKTTKRGGWDCLRHYEIIFNRAVPYFMGIESMPKNTMFRFPRSIVQEGMSCISSNGMIDVDRYLEVEQRLFDYSMENLTTISLAEYVLERTLGG